MTATPIEDLLNASPLPASSTGADADVFKAL
jgi:hypothetical protein